MKILLISPKMDKPNGGIAIWTEQYIQGCKEKTLDFEIVNTATVGVRSINGNAKRSFTDEFIRTKRIFKDLKSCLKKNEFDVVHLNTSCGTFGVIRDYFIAKKIKKKSPKAKIISHFHCDIPFQIHNSISKKFLKKLVDLSDDLLVLCTNSKQYLVNEFRADSKKVPNFINESAILKGEKTISKDLKKVFFTGRVSKAKGAFEIYSLAQKYPEIDFDLAGAVEEEMQAVDKPSNVHLLGGLPHEEILSRLDSADMFLFPSYSEGFSIALLEAMARGVPAIATDVGANKDMIEQGGGIIIPLENLDEKLCSAFEEMKGYERRVEMSKWCLNKVKKYTINEIVQSFIDIYKESL